MNRNRYRLGTLAALNLLIFVHAAAWFIFGWRGFGHSDPREFFVMMGTGAVGIGAIVLIVATLATVIGGRVFCGWACHMGSWQEVSQWALLKLGVRREILHSRLTAIVPVLMIFCWCLHYKVPEAWQTMGLPTSFHWDLSDKPPFVNTGGETVSPAGLLFELSVFLVGMQFFFGSKGVCRYLCPFAPFFRAADKVSIFRLRAVNASCDDCGECNRVCLMGIDVLGELKEHGEVRDSQCIKCMTCVDTCHTETIGYTARSVTFWNAPRTAPARAWFKRMAPLGIDLALAGALVGVFFLLPWPTIEAIIGEDEGFMLIVPITLFGGLAITTAWRKWGKKEEAPQPELVQIGGRIGKKVLDNKRTRKWNSMGGGWK